MALSFGPSGAETWETGTAVSNNRGSVLSVCEDGRDEPILAAHARVAAKASFRSSGLESGCER